MDEIMDAATDGNYPSMSASSIPTRRPTPMPEGNLQHQDPREGEAIPGLTRYKGEPVGTADQQGLHLMYNATLVVAEQSRQSVSRPNQGGRRPTMVNMHRAASRAGTLYSPLMDPASAWRAGHDQFFVSPNAVYKPKDEK